MLSRTLYVQLRKERAVKEQGERAHQLLSVLQRLENLNMASHAKSESSALQTVFKALKFRAAAGDALRLALACRSDTLKVSKTVTIVVIMR
jgi:hypothetical protein